MENKNEQKNETFSYSYSSQTQEEINRIRQKYEPKEENKLDKLRELDAGVTRKGTVAALIVGIISALVLGTGMSCCMVWGENLFVPGIIIGIIGIAGVSLAYPIYNRITKIERERVAPEIMRLSDELMK